MLVILGLVTIMQCGCTTGFIYTDTISPYCTNMRGSSMGTISSKSGTKQISIPVGRIDLTAIWSTRGLHDTATLANLKQIHGCDERIFSLLGGIWRKEEIIIYGISDSKDTPTNQRQYELLHNRS
jgi:hypothetical protein